MKEIHFNSNLLQNLHLIAKTGNSKKISDFVKYLNANGITCSQKTYKRWRTYGITVINLVKICNAVHIPASHFFYIDGCEPELRKVHLIDNGEWESVFTRSMDDHNVDYQNFKVSEFLEYINFNGFFIGDYIFDWNYMFIEQQNEAVSSIYLKKLTEILKNKLILSNVEKIELKAMKDEAVAKAEFEKSIRMQNENTLINVLEEKSALQKKQKFLTEYNRRLLSKTDKIIIVHSAINEEWEHVYNENK